jgi:hypothetical protein
MNYMMNKPIKLRTNPEKEVIPMCIPI